ncbi:DUF732 domain-containing protein [Mycobacterium sp. TNTM28]|uniref:DUF732 domain-containing protein n=1 Tax=[Mycobacterium] fortunisiensis TaxID=2600579 RepID=A0ABS6KSF4_9MYCO|nr:DUF732 domain-containing protein [[Mycobacterium] fortunisiensis]MBU9766575.1 DUF732 domain-containing protein [[Mycobacterium] fortunisiensis]
MSSPYETAQSVPGIIGETGWRPDPTGRHEGRYFISGQPTDLTRDGGVETLDPMGTSQLEGVAVQQDSSGGSRRWVWVLVAVVVAMTLVGAGVGAYLYLHRERVSPEDQYLAALKDSGHAGEFNSDANAVAHGRQVCRELNDGGPQQGMPADEVAVQNFCPEFAEGFHVLETATITGTFTLNDDSPSAYYPSIEVDGSTCAGAGGYSDVSAGTAVTVKNAKGEILTTTYLGPGHVIPGQVVNA